ncbi:hypothetical protein CRG98_001203 [Punica granatum]|uniref:Uncharacterized protein n=1 Tax=Punica granatum TaxID=22663 RepID=A0A2I0LCH8_PUNGR|nr:hypothetical protein CRG98_001203 [Punica granatum]
MLSFSSTFNGRADVARGEIVGHTCHVGTTSARPLDVDEKDNAGIDLIQKDDRNSSVGIVSTPFWPTGSRHEDSRPKLGLLFMTRQSEANARTWEHGLQKGSRVLQKAKKGNQENERTTNPENIKGRHCGTIHHRIIEVSEEVFLTGPPGRPIHEQVNDTRKQACTHLRTTGTKEQVSDCVSGFILVSRVDPDQGKMGHFLQKNIAGDSYNKSSVHEICANQSQGPQGLGR